MSFDPLSELLEQAGDAAFTPTESHVELLEKSAETLVAQSHDRHRLRELLQVLEQHSAAEDIPTEAGTASPFGYAALHALEGVTRALLAHDATRPSPIPADTRRVAASVLAKKHALEILRVIAQGDSRPANLKRATKLDDAQVHRVLSWAMSLGLLLRWGAEQNVHYRLSALGESVLEAIDEPQWVPMAATLVRIGVRQQMLARGRNELYLDDPESAPVKEASLLTGLGPEQAAHSLTELARVLQPAAVSNIAGALHYTPRTEEYDIIISPPVFHTPYNPLNRRSHAPELAQLEHSWAPRLDSLAESLVVRAVERAGIPTRLLREVLPHHYLRATKQARPYYLPLDLAREDGGDERADQHRQPLPIITIGGPQLNPVSLGLFFEYGVSVHLRHRPQQEVVWHHENGTETYPPSGDHDLGMFLRIFDGQTGASHFMMCGLGPSGTYAACRYFHWQAEELLGEFPEQSFATLLRVPRSYARRKRYQILVPPQPVETSANRNVRIDMRYVEVLPLLGAALLARREAVRGHVEGVARTKPRGNADAAGVRKLAQSGLDERGPICRRVREVASAYAMLGRFEELVRLVVVEVLERTGGDWCDLDHQRLLQRLQAPDGPGLSKFAAGAVARLITAPVEQVPTGAVSSHGARNVA